VTRPLDHAYHIDATAKTMERLAYSSVRSKQRQKDKLTQPTTWNGRFRYRDPDNGLAVIDLPNGTQVKGRFYGDPETTYTGDPVTVTFHPGSAVPSVATALQKARWKP